MSNEPERPTPRYGAWEQYEPEVVRRTVPLQYTFGHYYDRWDLGDRMTNCPFPDHPDEHPSMNLWAPDENGIPMRYGCFSCGKSGDVIDLIRFVNQCTFNEACRIAVEELAPAIRAAGWEPTNLVKNTVRIATPDILERILEGLMPMDAAGFDLLLRFMGRKGMSGEALERHAIEDWGWGATMLHGLTVTPAVYMPHRDTEGRLTGIKYRDPRRDGRWNEEGSRFPVLYGAWRDQGRKDVFIAEGETDTVCASYQLREQPIDVMGLPSGANQKPTPEMVAQLQNRTVYICGDGDGAGASANRTWFEAGLATYIVRIPEGKDILSCDIPVSELLETRSKQPREQTNAIEVRGTKFLRVEKRHNTKTDEDEVIKTPVADFAFLPERELMTVDGPAWEGRVTGQHEKTILRNQDLNDVKAFTRWAGERGARAFTGSQKDTQFIRNWVAAEADYLPLEVTSSKAGRIGRSFVGPGFCIGPDQVRYMAPLRGDAGLKDRLFIVKGPWDLQAIRELERLNDPAVMAVMLGWLVATLMRGKRTPCPPLFIAGESGAGKTHMTQTVLEAFGFDISANLTTTTPFGVDCFVSSTIGFPVWFDEYRSGARDDSMSRLRQMLRDAYNGQESVKGGMSANATDLTEVTTWSGIIVSGEMGTGETSLRDRLVYVELDPDMRNRDAYTYLHSDLIRGGRKPVSAHTVGLGDALLTYLASVPDTLFKVQGVGAPNLPDRFRETMGFVAAGWDIWLGFRHSLGFTDTPTGPAFTNLSNLRTVAEDPWLDALRHCEGISDKDGNPLVEQIGTDVKAILSAVVQEAKRVEIEIPAGAREFRAWLRRRYSLDETLRIGNRRGVLIRGLDLDKRTS